MLPNISILFASSVCCFIPSKVGKEIRITILDVNEHEYLLIKLIPLVLGFIYVITLDFSPEYQTPLWIDDSVLLSDHNQ